MFDVFQFLTMQFFNDVSKNCKTSWKRCILKMFLQRTVKCVKNIYLEIHFFLQIGYTEEIRAVNYHFFVQKSAQYRHKILNVCVKVCIKTRPKKSLVCSSKPPEKMAYPLFLSATFYMSGAVCVQIWMIENWSRGNRLFYFLIFYWNWCPQSSDSWHLCLPSLEMLSGEHGRELVWFGPD